MASTVYPKFKQQALGAGLNLTTLDVRAQLLSAAYTYGATHEFLSSVTGQVGSAVALTSKTVTDGVFDAADTTIPAVTGAAVTAILIYQHTGTAGTSRLIAYIDGQSFTPNGGDANIVWDSGANRIFAL